MKGLAHKVTCDMYNTMFNVTFDKALFCRKSGDSVDDDFTGCVFWSNCNQHIWLYLAKSKEGSIAVADAAHEAFHLADFIGERVGLQLSHGTGNEHYAYLIGFIIHKIFDCLVYDNEAEGLI